MMNLPLAHLSFLGFLNSIGTFYLLNLKRKTTSVSLGLIGVFLTLSLGAIAQDSFFTVRYQVTYDANSDQYTALVVPDYTVPNANNNTATEKGSTLQFSIIVPKDFIITQVTDVKGVWSKPGDAGFQKYGPGNPNQSFPGLDPSLNYYVFGKSPIETDLGAFAPNVPVALFTFKGNACFGPIQPLPKDHPFIEAADNLLSLNVANSFYSRSGQAPGGNTIPLQQFKELAGIPADCCRFPTCVPIGVRIIVR